MRQSRMCLLRPVPQGIEVHTPFDAAFVAAFKAAVPGSERRWVSADRVWIVSPARAQLVADLIQEHFAQSVTVPTATPIGAIETKMLRLEYLGAAKARPDGTQSAYGWTDGGWNCIFPIAVLQSWFCVDAKPGAAPTLYGILGLTQAAQPDEIKRSFRRLALQWHPDTCHEPDAAAQFLAIKDAYDVLSEPTKRARYNAGLQLSGMPQGIRHSYNGTYNPNVAILSDSTYRPPLRCGWLLVEGRTQVGRLVVSRILKWEDIVEAGKTMIVSWPRGADKFEVRWI